VDHDDPHAAHQRALAPVRRQPLDAASQRPGGGIALASDGSTLKKSRRSCRLAGKYELKIYAFDSRLHPIEHRGGTFAFPQAPNGQLTDLGTPLFEAARAEQGKRLVAAFLLSDGAQNAFEPQVEAVEAVRKLRDDFAAALFTVPFGPAADAAQARDVAVERFDEQFTVFVKNELAVKGLLRIRGYVNRDIPVELVLEDDQGQKQTIGKKTARAEEDGRQVEVEFAYTPQKPGHYRLHLVAQQQDGELVAKTTSSAVSHRAGGWPEGVVSRRRSGPSRSSCAGASMPRRTSSSTTGSSTAATKVSSTTSPTTCAPAATTPS
jgi:hypothetical protein